jgi:hypothetical protein
MEVPGRRMMAQAREEKMTIRNDFMGPPFIAWAELSLSMNWLAL